MVRVRAANAVQLSYLRHLQTSDETLDFWTDPYRVGKPVDIHVTPGKYEGLARSLSSAGIQHHIKVEDIGKAEKEERQTIELRRELTKNQKAFDFENYHTYEEVKIQFLALKQNIKKKQIRCPRLSPTWNNWLWKIHLFPFRLSARLSRTAV